MVTTHEKTAVVPLESGFPGSVVSELAGVTYRQLDHWVRQRYITPSVNPAVGKGARRLFSAGDIIQVAALGRFGRARLDIAQIGPLVAVVTKPVDRDRLIIVTFTPLKVDSIPANDLRSVVSRFDQLIAFDAEPVWERIDRLTGAVISTSGSERSGLTARMAAS